MSCDHHTHVHKGRLRCCKCGAEHNMRGWVAPKRIAPLKGAKCKKTAA